MGGHRRTDNGGVENEGNFNPVGLEKNVIGEGGIAPQKKKGLKKDSES